MSDGRASSDAGSGPSGTPAPAREGGLGDLVSRALETVGVTEELVSGWLGGPCNCRERREKMNSISRWAARVISGKVQGAKDFLNRILEG